MQKNEDFGIEIMVIVVRKKLEQITEETNNLVELVRDHFTEFQKSSELLRTIA